MLKKALIFAAALGAFVVTDRCAYRAVEESIVVARERAENYWFDVVYFTDGISSDAPAPPEAKYSLTVHMPDGTTRTTHFNLTSGETKTVLTIRRIEGRFTKYIYRYE